MVAPYIPPPTPASYASLYDFSLIEKAVQAYFLDTGLFSAPPDENDPARESWAPVAGKPAVFTAYDAAVFQKAIPRVACYLSSISPATATPRGVVDSLGAIRNNLWKANLALEIITAPNYTQHTALRSLVTALGEMLVPQLSDPTNDIGANKFSTTYFLAYCVAQNHTTQINAHEGFYGSQLNYQLTFGVPAGAITAVTG